METDEIVFSGKPYEILERLYRTVGSRRQKLVKGRGDNVERRRAFYIVECDGQQYWVKEYVQFAPGHDIDYEFAETQRLHSTTQVGSDEIRTVRMFEVENDKLLMEYCEGYVKLHEAPLMIRQKKVVGQLIRMWLREHPSVHNYDMCGNNILIKSNGSISIRLIDFEYSLKMSHQLWMQTPNVECWYNKAETIRF